MKYLHLNALLVAAAVLAAASLGNLTPVTKAGALGTSCTKQTTFALALHGGAVWGRSAHPRQEAFVRAHLESGRARLASGDKAVDIVTAMVIAMEDSGLFNAGKGSVANRDGDVEMDASIMDGRHLRAGAVASIKNLKNPVAAARLVMDDTPQVMMVGPSADKRLAELGAERVEQHYFLHSGRNFTDVVLPEGLKLEQPDAAASKGLSAFAGVWAGVLAGRLNHVLVVERVDAGGGDAVVAFGVNESLGLSSPVTIRARAKLSNGYLVVETEDFRMAYKTNDRGRVEARIAVTDGPRATGILRSRPDLLKRGGTVGAVALDRCGNLAAATSTGGFGSKPPGRVGDSPVIGAGTYADNRSAAVSATGHGEYFIRHAVAHDIAARIRHGGQSLAEAANQVIFEELKPVGGNGGIIAIDRNGEVVMLYNTAGMVRGSTTDRRPPHVATFADD